MQLGAKLASALACCMDARAGGTGGAKGSGSIGSSSQSQTRMKKHVLLAFQPWKSSRTLSVSMSDVIWNGMIATCALPQPQAPS